MADKFPFPVVVTAFVVRMFMKTREEDLREEQYSGGLPPGDLWSIEKFGYQPVPEEHDDPYYQYSDSDSNYDKPSDKINLVLFHFTDF